MEAYLGRLHLSAFFTIKLNNIGFPYHVGILDLIDSPPSGWTFILLGILQPLFEACDDTRQKHWRFNDNRSVG